MDEEASAAYAAILLARGDAFGALKAVSLARSSRALVLRGIALARLGELDDAQRVLGRAVAALRGEAEPLALARALVALGETALARRDLTTLEQSHGEALRTLDEARDRVHAAYLRILLARQRALLGDADGANALLEAAALRGPPPLLESMRAIAQAELAMRSRNHDAASWALRRAKKAVAKTALPSLAAEVERMTSSLGAPVAELVRDGEARAVSLADIERVAAAPRVLFVDACRRLASAGKWRVDLTSRPVLLALLVALAARGEVARDDLVREAFGARSPNASHRVRLRVEIGRLRKLLAARAALRATEIGFRLDAKDKTVALLRPLEPGPQGGVRALLADGRAWSAADVASALGLAPRSAQRHLAELREAGAVDAIGAGKTLRYALASSASAPQMLLLGLHARS